MKIRTGFVSNSSSSSFVVILPSRPESVEDVEKIFFPNGYDYHSYWYDDGEEPPVTARMLAEKLWEDIQEQRQTDDVIGRLAFMCRERYFIRDADDALCTMGVPKRERELLYALEKQDRSAFGEAFINLMIEKARSYGASIRCFPPKDTKEVYLLGYGSGCGPVEQAMFNTFGFLAHLPFVVVMES